MKVCTASIVNCSRQVHCNPWWKLDQVPLSEDVYSKYCSRLVHCNPWWKLDQVPLSEDVHSKYCSRLVHCNPCWKLDQVPLNEDVHSKYCSRLGHCNPWWKLVQVLLSEDHTMLLFSSQESSLSYFISLSLSLSFFNASWIPCGKFGLPYLGKATAAARAALTILIVCPNSGMAAAVWNFSMCLDISACNCTQGRVWTW